MGCYWKWNSGGVLMRRTYIQYIHACISPTFNRILAPSTSGREGDSRLEVRIFYIEAVDRIISS